MKKGLILSLSAMITMLFSATGYAAAVSGASCQSTGTVHIYETIIVDGNTFDGGCQTFIPVGMGDGGQGEDQDPAFRVQNGGTLKNVILGAPGVDGVHLYNSATVDNFTWNDVGEDALTVKSSGTYYIRNIEGYNAYDKFFQLNAECTFNVSNAIIHGAGKALRQNGGTSFKVNVTFDNCDIRDMSEAVFRSDSSSSTARITNSCLDNVGEICYGNWGSCSSSGITWGTCIVDDIPAGDNSIFNGTYSMLAVHSGKALDTWGWGTSDGTNIVQYSYWGGAAQQFNVSSVDGIWHRISPAISSGQAVDVAGCSPDNLANIQTWSYWGGTCQQFRFQKAGSGRWRIIGRNGEKCLDVINWSQDDGANVIQYDCISGSENQIFEMIRH